MKNGKYVLGLVVVALVCLSVAARAQAPQPQKVSFTFYNVTAVSGAAETDAYGMSNSGQIVGDYIESDGTTWHGMICNKPNKGTCSSVTNIDDSTSGAEYTQVYAINKSGDAVGFYELNGLEQGFLYQSGTYTNIGPSGAVSAAYGINDKGLIVGGYIDPNTGIAKGFLYNGTTYTDLVPSTSCASTSVLSGAAWGINNKNWITVFCVNSSGDYDAYLTKNEGKTFTKIDVPGATQSVAHTINDAGDIVYTIFDSSGNRHGVLYYNKTYTQFDATNGTNSTRADGLNNKLLIVGRYGSTGPNGSASGPGTGYEAITKTK